MLLCYIACEAISGEMTEIQGFATVGPDEKNGHPGQVWGEKAGELQVKRELSGMVFPERFLNAIRKNTEPILNTPDSLRVTQE